VHAARALAVVALASAAAAASAACGSNDAAPADAGADVAPGPLGCANEPGVDAFAPGLTHRGPNGLSFVIAAADAVPPAADNNTWTVKILDPGGAPASGAVVTLPKGTHPSDPWMPAHTNHGTISPAITDLGGGSFTIAPLYLFMSGVWSLRIDAQVGGVTDSTTFSVCVGG